MHLPRTTLSITVLAATLAAGLLTTPVAAQANPDRPNAPAATDVSPDDAIVIRSIVDDEARHRDRVARVNRLRTLAEQSGQTERLAALDRLDRMERDRHEAHRLRENSRLSATAQRDADDFVRRGGTLTMRRRAAAADQSVDGRAPVRARSGSGAVDRPGDDRAAPQRKAVKTTRSSGSRPVGAPMRSSSRGGSRGGSRGSSR